MRPYVLLSLALSGFGCGKAAPNTDGGPITIIDAGPSSHLIGGVSQKGPFITGADVVVSELDGTLASTGRTAVSQIADDLGTFATTLTASNAVEVVVTGYYFDEVSNSLSTSTLSLRAVAGLEGNGPVDVNVLTTLEKRRVVALVESGKTLSEAKVQAQAEVLRAFGVVTNNIGSSETLDISKGGDGNAMLLAVSVILDQAAMFQSDSGATVPAQLSTLIAQIGADLEDGSLDDPNTKSLLSRAARGVNMSAVRASLEARYASLGEGVSIPNFEDFIDSNGNGILNGTDPVPTGSEQLVALSSGVCNNVLIRLIDGRVLIAGGTGTGITIFDPVANAFVDGGQLTMERQSPAAALLQDGGVLIVGSSQGTLDGTAEVYDPVSGLSHQTAGGTTKQHTSIPAVSLDDGRVLLAGGYDQNSGFIATSEVYVPTTGHFAAVGSLASPRAAYTATKLLDGRVLISGGISDGNSHAVAQAEIFDPSTNSFSTTAAMLHARVQHTATLLPDGRVLIVGGMTPQPSGEVDPIAEAEIFDPSTGTFDATDNLFVPRIAQGAALVGRQVWFFGGFTHVTITDDVEYFDVDSSLFRQVGHLGETRSYSDAISLPDGRILMVGGQGLTAAGQECLASAVLWTP